MIGERAIVELADIKTLVDEALNTRRKDRNLWLTAASNELLMGSL